MSVFEWQGLIYPILLVESLLAAATNLGIYILVNRSANILVISAFFLVSSASFAVLTMVTGTNPILNIDQFRPLILHTRSAMAIILLVYVCLQAERILRR